MSDYTLRTEGVRIACEMALPGIYPRASRREAFNRWLEQVKAEAWEEGHEAAAMRVPEGVWHDTAAPRTPNPYREEQDA